MNKFAAFLLSLAVFVLGSPALAADKPLVIKNGHIQQLPSADALQVGNLTLTGSLNGDTLVPSIAIGFQDTGSTWPYQDFDVVRHSYGTIGTPIVPLITGPAFYTPERIETYIGSGHEGGVQGRLNLLQIRGTSGASTTNRNYVADEAYTSATVTDGGANTTRLGSLGQVFSGDDLAVLYPGATNWHNITGREVDVEVASGASVSYKSGIQITEMPADAVAGATDDYALSFSNQTGAIGWKNLIGISGANGVSPLQTTGCVLCVFDSPTFATGINFIGATISGNAFASAGFSVDGSGAVTASKLTLATALQLPKYAAASLPTCNSGAEGMLVAVTDANSATFNASVAGGGSNHVMAYCNGTGWTVH